MKAFLKQQWARSDKDGSGTIDLHEFLRWYSMNRFKEELLLTPDQRRIRELAHKYGMKEKVVDGIKQTFDLFDTDRSGLVEQVEFRQILIRMMRVPPDVDLPDCRVASLWQELEMGSCHLKTLPSLGE